MVRTLIKFMMYINCSMKFPIDQFWWRLMYFNIFFSYNKKMILDPIWKDIMQQYLIQQVYRNMSAGFTTSEIDHLVHATINIFFICRFCPPHMHWVTYCFTKRYMILCHSSSSLSCCICSLFLFYNQSPCFTCSYVS